MKTRLTALLLATLVCSVASTSAVSAPLQSRVERVASLEQSVLKQLNAVRAAHGVRPLVLSPGLRTAAATHSRAMLSAGFFSHRSKNGAAFSERIRRSYASRGFNSWSVGENIFFASDSISPAAALAAWMASPPHRRNLLSPAWREVGVGVTRTAAAPGVFGGGSAWVITMDFGVRSGGAKPSA